ncbi:zinc-binding dehydrogenase [Enterobacter hormaechei]|uniref:zinc-binding dehydrogenase n=2 Tax=Enterobacterales TaxID=91347 RepID=UPI0020183946|nr:zinc-binding dehydrogenase [Enterobacter hormaechei]
MLSDIFPTGWHATELAGLRAGESVAIYGAGPVGLMAAHSALLKGASQVFVIDTHADRLALAEKMGATVINAVGDEAVQAIMDLTDGRGTDCGCECVGYQCCNKHGHEDNSATMNALVASTKATGGIGVVGVFIPQDPGAATELAKEGKMPFDFGNFWFKGQSIRTGQANVKAYNRQLSRLIYQGKAAPGQIISHRLELKDAPDAYKNFDERSAGWTKVILKP